MMRLLPSRNLGYYVLLLMMILTSRSVNHPLGRHLDLVCEGDGGIMKNPASEMTRQINPSMRKSHFLSSGTRDVSMRANMMSNHPQSIYHPAFPAMPLISSNPTARKDETRAVTVKMTQKKPSRIGSSNLVYQ